MSRQRRCSDHAPVALDGDSPDVRDFTAERLRAEIEMQFTVGAPTLARLSVTNEPYVVIGSQINSVPSEPGTVDEGAEREFAYDIETAYYHALACFASYADGKSGKLYWRTPPEFCEWDTPDGKRCHFYMRCLISDKPEHLAA